MAPPKKPELADAKSVHVKMQEHEARRFAALAKLAGAGKRELLTAMMDLYEQYMRDQVYLEE